MTDLGPMPPTPDIGPVAADCGSLQPIAPNVWAWIGNGPGNAGLLINDDGNTVIDRLLASADTRAVDQRTADPFGITIQCLVHAINLCQSGRRSA